MQLSDHNSSASTAINYWLWFIACAQLNNRMNEQTFELIKIKCTKVYGIKLTTTYFELTRFVWSASCATLPNRLVHETDPHIIQSINSRESVFMFRVCGCPTYSISNAFSLHFSQSAQLIHFFVHKLWAHFLSTFLLLSAFDINKGTSHHLTSHR